MEYDFKYMNLNNKSIETEKIDIATNYILKFLKQCSIDKNRIVVDNFLYMASTLAGISCAVTAQQQYIETSLQSSKSNEHLAIIETESGDFIYGNLINNLLYESKYSVWNLISISHKKGNMPTLPDIQKIITDTAKKIGKKDAKVWNGLHDPYKEITMAKKTYDSICSNLASFNIQAEEMNISFSYALVNIINETFSFFPKEINCIEFSLDTVFFYAHMDCK